MAYEDVIFQLEKENMKLKERVSRLEKELQSKIIQELKPKNAESPTLDVSPGIPDLSHTVVKKRRGRPPKK